MQELFFLLLPVALVSGWFLGRKTKGRSAKVQDEVFRSGYFKGLNYVLNEQPDKAIEIFCQMMEVDSETLETHFALGNLFRRRGEVDRAIRIHQNIIARPSLSKPERALALLELGEDYMKAGLFDRAENLFLELVRMDFYLKQANHHLVAIYEQEKDWTRAIASAQMLLPKSDGSVRVAMAHYYCELAELEAEDETASVQWLNKARKVDPACVRAHIALAHFSFEAGRYKQAQVHCLEVPAHDRPLLPLVMPTLRDSFSRQNNTEGFRSLLEDLLKSAPGVDVILELVDLEEEKNGPQAAARFALDRYLEYPSVLSLKRYVDVMQRETSDSGDTHAAFNALYEVVQAISLKQARYRCNHCGFTARSMHWQCPGCKSWSSIKPVDNIIDCG